jgi:5-methylcytosine-specific restriction endonuclease McrA
VKQTTCRACASPIKPTVRGRPKVWCSEACRVWAHRNPGVPRPMERNCRDCGSDISHRHGLAILCETCASPAPISERPCSVCGAAVQPSTTRQHLCPPKNGEKRSRCAKRWERHIRDGTRLDFEFAPFDCAQCGKHCIPGENCGSRATKYCDQDCKWKALRPKPGPTCRIKKRKARRFIEGRCPECGDRFMRLDNNPAAVGYCTRRCQRRVINRRREAFKRGKGRKTLTFWKIAERDNLTCQLCGELVLMTETAPHPQSPSLDHIVPLSRGGSHSEENVQLAHFICNSRKGNGTAVTFGGQMSLV